MTRISIISMMSYNFCIHDLPEAIRLYNNDLER